MANQSLDLQTIFKAVSAQLQKNQGTLNTVDVSNPQHGDHMVETFQLINSAIQQKPGATPSEQLTHASQVVRKKAGSQSGQIYAKNLLTAAQQLKGQQGIDANNVATLLQSLMGSGQAQQQAQQQAAPAGGADLLGSLAGALMGGQTQQAAPQAGNADMIGSLVGSLLGGQAQTGQQAPGINLNDGLGLDDLLGAGSLLMGAMGNANAQQQGGDPMSSLVGSLLSGSPLGASPARAQSGSVVVNTIMGLLGGKK